MLRASGWFVPRWIAFNSTSAASDYSRNVLRHKPQPAEEAMRDRVRIAQK
jgi:hypothetical protein